MNASLLHSEVTLLRIHGWNVGGGGEGGGVTKSTGADEKGLSAVLQKQQRVIGRAQALACGMTQGALHYRIRDGGLWQRLLPGTYLAATGAPTTSQWEIAALVYAGSGSVITGAAALRHHGIRAPETAAITVLIPARRSVRSTGPVRIWRTTRMPPIPLNDGPVRVALPARAVADTARALSRLSDVRAVVADAVQSRRCPIFLLEDELDEGPRRGSALLRQVIDEVRGGVRSVAEAEFRDLLRRARLPPPMFNARILAGDTFVATVDAWWQRAGVAAEVDSREWHLRPADWERTMRRHRAMTAHGILVLHFTPRMIRNDPASVAKEVRDALEAGSARPPLAVRALPAAG
jgi:very-short-patch-repair endonuclease